jgi:hypothetical protein
MRLLCWCMAVDVVKFEWAVSDSDFVALTPFSECPGTWPCTLTRPLG